MEESVFSDSAQGYQVDGYQVQQYQVQQYQAASAAATTTAVPKITRNYMYIGEEWGMPDDCYCTAEASYPAKFYLKNSMQGILASSIIEKLAIYVERGFGKSAHPMFLYIVDVGMTQDEVNMARLIAKTKAIEKEKAKVAAAALAAVSGQVLNAAFESVKDARDEAEMNVMQSALSQLSPDLVARLSSGTPLTGTPRTPRTPKLNTPRQNARFDVSPSIAGKRGSVDDVFELLDPMGRVNVASTTPRNRSENP
jgi:hypothetical protein